MKPLYTIVAVLVAVALIGSIGATSLQQQASAFIIYGNEFKDLTKDLEKAVLDELATPPPDNDKIQRLLDDYSAAVMELIRTPSPSP